MIRSSGGSVDVRRAVVFSLGSLGIPTKEVATSTGLQFFASHG